MTEYWGGGTRHFFLLTLYNFKNIGGGGRGAGARAPPAPLLRGPCFLNKASFSDMLAMLPVRASIEYF